MSGNAFRDAVKDYIESWSKNNNLNIDIEIEKVVGYRFVGSLRKVDIVLHKDGKFLGIECKYQEVEGTAYQKLIYTLDDCKNTPILCIIVFSGNGIKHDVKSKLITSGMGIEVNFINGKIVEKPFPVLLQRIAIELGINWLKMF
jgi:hypothetical protein